MLEITTLEEFDSWAGENPSSLPAAIQNVDLSSRSELLTGTKFPNSIFLACNLEPTIAGHVVTNGGVVIPRLDGVQFEIHRARLYSVAELFKGFDVNRTDGYQMTYDYSVYAEYLEQGKDEPPMIWTSLARRLHDHAITDALREAIDGKKVVAVMGGHGMERQEDYYSKVARVSRKLTQAGYLMVSGGGPGAMEATHLGAYFATRDESDLQDAIDFLAVRPKGAEPGKEYADADWLHRARKILDKYPLGDDDFKACQSIGIPTWLYGHEPPAPFATHIAKYFANSVREDGLLAIAKHGVIFAPGSAGTTQEIFQDAAQNHYATQGVYSPMILFGSEHWTKVRPVWPLIREVAKDQKFGELLALTDSEAEIIDRIKSYDPANYTPSN